MASPQTILYKENNEVAEYQSQVAVTSEQMHKILGAEHNEILTLADQGGADSPDDLIRIRKDLLLRLMENNLAQARSSFATLN